VSAVISPQNEEALAVLIRHGEAIGAPLHVFGQDWVTTEERGRLVYQDGAGLIDLPAPRLFGRHQYANAGTAIAALRAARLGLPTGAFEKGLVTVDWPARLQRLGAGQLPPLAPAESELWLDGGHNPEGGRALAAALADLEDRVSRPLVLVVGMLSTKDCEGFLRNFAGLARRLVAVPIHQERTLAPEAIADVARRIGIPADCCENVESALALIGRFDLLPPPRILVAGSLYLAGEVLAANGTAPT